MNNASCDVVTGECQCTAGWTGLQCQHRTSHTHTHTHTLVNHKTRLNSSLLQGHVALKLLESEYVDLFSPRGAEQRTISICISNADN